MKKEICVLFLTLVMCAAALLFIPSNIGTDEEKGGGQGEPDYSWAKLDYDYMYDVTKNLSDIVFTYDRGKEFGTRGERDAADLIETWMNNIGLDCVHQEPINAYWSEDDRWDNDTDPYTGNLSKVKNATRYYLNITVWDVDTLIDSKIWNETWPNKCFPFLKRHYGGGHNVTEYDVEVVESYKIIEPKQIIILEGDWEDPYESWAKSTDIYPLPWFYDKVKGFILVDDSDETFFMGPTMYDNRTYAPYIKPGFSINGTDGQWIKDYVADEADYSVKANITNEWEWEFRESYNVIGQINGTSDDVALIGCHYDSWWNQGAIDEDASVGAILGIAKYFKDNNITPEYTLKFVAFGGEECGYRGSKDYIKKMGDEHIKYMLCPGNWGHNTLEWENENKIDFTMGTNKFWLGSLMKSIADDLEFEEKTGTPAKYSLAESALSGEDNYPFYMTENADLVVQFSRWPFKGYHRDGDNHNKGDVMDILLNQSYQNESKLITAITVKLTVEYNNSLQTGSQNGWNLFSLQVNETIDKWDLYVYYDGSLYNWTEAATGLDPIILGFVYGWDEENQVYELSLGKLKPGKGYWVYAFYDCNLIFSSYALVDSYITDLQYKDWHLISLPFDSFVDKTDIIVNYDGTDYTWQQAVDNDLILNFLYSWDGANQNYDLPCDTLEPGRGYWMYVYDDEYTYTLVYNGPGLDKGGDKDGGGSSWDVELEFNESINGTIAVAYFGEDDNADDGPPADEYDVPMPPTPIEPYVRAWFDDNLSSPYDKLMKDYRSTSDDEKIWNLSVQWKPENSTNTTINITWSPDSLNDSGYNEVVLYDIANDTVVDMLEESYYNYSTVPTIPRSFQIRCTNSTKPEILNVSDSPDVVGFGFGVNITAEVIDNTSGVDSVKVNVTYPDDTTGNFTMNHSGNNTYSYVFSDTWLVGQYNYTIWALDKIGWSNSSTGHSFNVSANATITIATIKDHYVSGEYINITDPPVGGIIGYEYLDNNRVLHIWNQFDSYYFNTSSGIQLTNHYNEYWSHNVLMLGYYNNDNWNLIYRTDELTGFNKNIQTDNSTYINVTLWKDLEYMGYDFRLAIRYYLGYEDNELTIIPYIKNLGDSIPYTLGFAWGINKIQIDMTPENDYILINESTFDLNENLDLTFVNMTHPVYCWNETLNESLICGYEPIPYFHIREDFPDNNSKSLFLRWDSSLNYKVWIKSRNNSYNAPVILGIKIGSLDVDQSKHTEIFWHDASTVTYYFDGYSPFENWANNPANMVDGDIGRYASTSINLDVERCTSNSCTGTDLGSISKVELRTYGYLTVGGWKIRLRPVFKSGDGDNHDFTLSSTPQWSSWFDITNDNNAPDSWYWKDVDTLDCDVDSVNEEGAGEQLIYCSKVEVRVTYTGWIPPCISNPTPADGSEGIDLTPTVGITVSDVNNDSLDISWLSNSSGSWQVFGTNNSVYNGTYYQTFSNATVNGQWWYWKVNVSDGKYYNESSVFKFYTGVQSKIKNTGSTDIRGYVLIQVQYYHEEQGWIVDNDTVNESTPRTINISEQLGLDTIFNGLITTSDLSNGYGTYRVYAALRDPDGNILHYSSEDYSYLKAWYEFEYKD